MPKLTFHLFGTYDVMLCNTSLKKTISAKPMALFIYLAMKRREHTRDSLINLFWPDTDDQRARQNFRFTLSELNKVVAPYLSVSHHTVAFKRQSDYWSDAEAFNAVLAKDTSLVDTETLQSAVDLYQGQFLDGLYTRNSPAFEEWVTRTGEGLQFMAMSGLQELTERYIVQGKYLLGLTTAHQLLALEPWREEAHVQRMKLLMLGGQRSAALKQYETCRVILDKELGIAPSRELQTLFEDIRNDRFDVDKLRERTALFSAV